MVIELCITTGIPQPVAVSASVEFNTGKPTFADGHHPVRNDLLRKIPTFKVILVASLGLWDTSH